MENNGNGNGGKSPVVMRKELPIIGQAFTFKGFLLQVFGTCNCSPRPEPLLIVGGRGSMSAPCPNCGRRAIIQRMGEMDLEIGLTVPEPAAQQPPVG